MISSLDIDVYDEKRRPGFPGFPSLFGDLLKPLALLLQWLIEGAIFFSFFIFVFALVFCVGGREGRCVGTR